MDAYDVFIEPSVVSHCLGCNLISSSVKHLVTAKSTLLEVFEVVKIPLSTANNSVQSRLKLVGLFKLQGEVTDLKPIRTVENPQLDYLLVSTKNAKVSCVRWDPFRNSIQTVSLHYYEHTLQNLTYENLSDSKLVVGPKSSLVFCLRSNNLLVFLPFNKLAEDDDDDVDEEATETVGKSNGKDVKMEDAENEVAGNANGDSVDKSEQSKDQNGGVSSSSNVSLFESSYIVEASDLDENIGDIVDLQFLYRYRQPTVAIISQKRETWAGLLPKTKDNVIFTVLSLDIHTRSATVVLKVENLPYDLDRIIPLPSPLNGSLLVGCNELIHVDSGGITRRIALNKYTVDITTSIKSYVDQSLKDLKLEGCSIAPLPNDNKLLMILRTGDLYYVRFEVDGKTIKRMVVEDVDKEKRKDINVVRPGEITTLDTNLIFVASKGSNSLLLELNYAEETAPEVKEEEFIAEDEDDFYAEDEKVKDETLRYGPLTLIKQDELTNNGPISSFTFGQYSKEKFIANLPNPSSQEVSIFATGGIDSAGHINVFTPTVQPVIKSSLRFSEINRLWALNNKYLITSDDTNQKSEIFAIDQGYSRLPAKSFINNELTIAMHELNNGKFIVQVTPKHIVLFNDKFKKITSLDEELKEYSDADIINSVFNDEFLMIFFSTGEVVIYSINTYNKTFSKIELPKLLSETILTTGYITNSRLLNVVSNDVSVLVNRGHKRKRDTDVHYPMKSENAEFQNNPKLKTFVLVTGDNRIIVFNRFHNEKCFQLNSVDKFTDILSLGFFDINGEDPDPHIKQVMLNDLGDEYSKDEYLTILTVGGEIFSYQLFFDGENYSFVKQTSLPITGAPFNAYAHGTSIERRLIYFPTISGLTCILVTGVVPYLITRSRYSTVKIFKFSKIPIVSFVPFSDDKIHNGLIYLDTQKNARIVELPSEFRYDFNLPLRKIHIGATVKSVAYHEGSDTFVLSTYKEIPYKCIDEEGNPIVGIKPDKPTAISYQGLIKLLSPINWSVIDQIELAENEVGLHVKSVPLDVGSETKRFKNKKEFILVGTGKYRIEDLASNGSYILLEIIDIVPERGRPETNHKFKEFTKEDTKGAVTSICDVSGRFLVAQGQKIIVRDIKDNSAVPVAFLDTSVYVSEAKSFGNLVILGDTLKSVWLAGFDAEPFRMIMLGKDSHNFDASAADFLIKDEEIYIVVADNDKAIHVLHYNPEDPHSANGQKLLHKSTFNTNYSTTCMKSIPKNEQLHPTTDNSNVPFQTIGSSVEGAMYVVCPVNENTYRRMYILQQQLSDKEFHHCGLNPRLNRIGIHASKDGNLRPVLDIELLRRFAKLNEDRKRTLSQKVGMQNVQVDLWKDLIEFENLLNNL